MDKIRIVIVEPYKEARIAEVPATLEEYQKIVGGYIECIHPFEDAVTLVCNEEGKIKRMPLNRVLDMGGYADAICGTFFIVGVGVEDFVSLTHAQAEKYRRMFADWKFFD